MKKHLLILMLVVIAGSSYAQMRLSFGIKDIQNVGSDSVVYMNGFSFDALFARKVLSDVEITGGFSGGLLNSSDSSGAQGNMILSPSVGLCYERLFTPNAGIRISPSFGVSTVGTSLNSVAMRCGVETSVYVPISRHAEIEPLVGICWYADRAGSALQLFEVRSGLRVGYSFNDFDYFN